MCPARTNALALQENIHDRTNTLLKPSRPVGIIGYGAYVPRYRLPAREVARIGPRESPGLPSRRRPSPADEDVITMSIERPQRHETRRDRPG